MAALRVLPAFVLGLCSANALAVPPPPPPAPAKSEVRPVVKLQKPGAKPRAPLRYKFTVGDKQTMAMKMEMQMGMEMGGKKAPIPRMPAMVFVMDFKVASVSPEGDARIDFVVSDVKLEATEEDDPALMKHMQTSLASMKGLSGSNMVSSRGFASDATISVPPGAAPEVVQQMEGLKGSVSQMVLPLPEEPVGLGGRWEAKAFPSMNGIGMKQITNAELQSRKDDIAKVKVTIRQTAEKQEVLVKGQPSGVQIESMINDGTGESELDLGHPVPLRAVAKVSGKTKMDAPTGAMTMDMSMVATMTRRTNDPAAVPAPAPASGKPAVPPPSGKPAAGR